MNMIERYRDEEIAKIWSDEHKLTLWQKTELAAIEGRVNLKKIPSEVYKEIFKTLMENPIDIDWWKARDAEVKHDLNAFLDERLRFLPPELQIYFHQKLTSYDTEEPAFAQMLIESLMIVKKYLAEVETILREMALKYRFTPMNARTHGQEAKLQTFGKRCLSWYRDLSLDGGILEKAGENLQYSKLSGAIGNYGDTDPELEEETLRILGFKPYYGATQIMPREIYTPLAQTLSQIVSTLNKIALAIRLGARSGRPICQEPFGKKQKGSSAMPHKKNTISTEQIEGMSRMAREFCDMIETNISTWEERAIEQSSVERVAWPDLFHVVVHSLKTMAKVLKGLVVFPDNMLLEIIDSRGCYASDEAKEVLTKLGLSFGLNREEAYRIVQLSAFNAFEPDSEIERLRTSLPTSLTEIDEVFIRVQKISRPTPISIKDIIAEGILRVSPQLEATEEDVQKWNEILKKIFSDSGNRKIWDETFLPSNLLRNEAKLYKEILDA
jgi:adenylosuccinate lyase